MLYYRTAILFLIVVFVSCSSLNDKSTNTIIKESLNQQGSKKAVLFLKEAGATVADSYQVTVCDSDYAIGKSEAGNTFTVDTNHGQAFFDPASISFTWISNDTLQIAYDKNLREFIQEKRVDGVTVVYKPK